MFADLVVIRGDSANPYRAVIEAKPEDVLLTTVSGEILYGASEIVDGLVEASGREHLTAVDACGEERWLRVTEPDARIPQGDQTLEQIQATFKADGIDPIAPMVDCGGIPASAFEP